MKNVILLSFLFIIGISQSYGQFQIGVAIGINQSNIEVKLPFDFESLTDSRTGYFLSVSSKFPISEKVNLAVDVQYSQKGFKSSGPNISHHTRIAYADLIPELEFEASKFLTLGVGVNYGFRLSERFKLGDGDWEKSNFGKVTKPSDFGLTGKIKVNHKKIFGFVRYNYGLKNTSEGEFTDENGQIIEDGKLINKNLQIGVGYTFNLKKNKL